MGRKKAYRAPEGLIRLSRSCNWYIKRTIAGKTVFKSTGTSDLFEAEKVYHHVMEQLLKEHPQNTANRILGKSLPFPKVVERYLKEISPLKNRGGRNDINSSKPLLKFFVQAKIDGVSKQDIYKYLDWRKNTISEKTGKPLSGSTVNREKSLLSDIFRKAIRWGYVNENPVVGIEGFSENRRERYITDLEFKAILSKMSQAHRDMFLALYHTAQRPGRIYNLQWKQINLNERSITFENTSRNKRAPRKLWISDVLYEILIRYKRYRRVLTPYVFYKPSLKPYSEFDALKIWRKATKEAKVENTRPYDIRHKAITDMKKAGFNDAQVGHVVAHSDPRTTKRYTHFSAKDTRMPLESLAGKNIWDMGGLNGI